MIQRLCLLGLCVLGMGACGPTYAEGETVPVATAPPPLRYEVARACGPRRLWVPGAWEWRGRWKWQRGRCEAVRGGRSWVSPGWREGVYRNGYWAPAGATPPPSGALVPPPAPVY